MGIDSKTVKYLFLSLASSRFVRARASRSSWPDSSVQARTKGVFHALEAGGHEIPAVPPFGIGRPLLVHHSR